MSGLNYILEGVGSRCSELEQACVQLKRENDQLHESLASKEERIAALQAQVDETAQDAGPQPTVD